MQLRTLLYRFVSCALLAVLLPAGITCAQQTAKPRPIVTLDRIVAVVNEEVITQQELAARVDFAFRQLRQQGTPPPPREVIERQLIERLINDRVQMQFARDIGLHYARTLHEWRRRFLARLPAVRRLGHGEEFIRMWEFYLAYCEGGFLERSISDVQLLLDKPGGGNIAAATRSQLPAEANP